MIDGISMIGKETFGHLDRVLKAIIHNSSPFGGVSLLVVGNFLQLSPVKLKTFLNLLFHHETQLSQRKNLF